MAIGRPARKETEAMVSKPEWGMKRICPSCGARYYDLHREPVICPKCGANYDPDTLLKSRRARPPVAPEPIEPIADEEVDADVSADEVEGESEEEGDEVPAEGDTAAEGEEEEEEEVIEDGSELGEDEDDMAEVIENVEDEEER